MFESCESIQRDLARGGCEMPSCKFPWLPVWQSAMSWLEIARQRKEDKEKESNATDVKLQFGRPNLMIFGQPPTEGIVNFVLV